MFLTDSAVHPAPGKATINVFFRDEEARGVFLVSVCFPVNGISCYGLDISIVPVSNVIRGTAVASWFSLPRKDAVARLHKVSMSVMVIMQMSKPS